MNLPRIVWDAVGSRQYETGIDRGVLYVDTQAGVPWNGLTAVTESSPGGIAKSFYVDGEKYANLPTREEYQATLTAYTYPEEFEICDGLVSIRSGLFLTKQKRISFGLSYRTKIGNDQDDSYAYKIHIIYNVLAAPSNRAFKTTNNSMQVDQFSWVLTSLPLAQTGYLRTSHIVIDSRVTDPQILSAIEDILYGDDAISSRLPTLPELLDLIDTGDSLIVTDNGDGTATLTAPIVDLMPLDASVWQLTWSTVVYIDGNTCTISSG